MNGIERVFGIFKELNQIPRPSHHEERIADYLCQFAERLHLKKSTMKKIMHWVLAAILTISAASVFTSTPTERRSRLT